MIIKEKDGNPKEALKRFKDMIFLTKNRAKIFLMVYMISKKTLVW